MEELKHFNLTQHYFYNMALGFYRLDTEEYLFVLNDEQHNCLSQIFEMFHQWTGLEIDLYKDTQLTTENCRTLIQVIDKYVHQTDINSNKRKTIVILGFRGLLEYFIGKNTDFQLRGD